MGNIIKDATVLYPGFKAGHHFKETFNNFLINRGLL